MEGNRRHHAGAAAGRLSVEGTLLRAALLAGYEGGAAADVARRLAAATRPGDGRSCLEAGSPLQLTVDAPGPAGLRAGIRLGDGMATAALGGLVPSERLHRLRRALEPMPAPEHRALGTWLFWTERRQSVFVDLRDPDPAQAMRRLRTILDGEQVARLERAAPQRHPCRPWALRLEAGDRALERIHVHWLLRRHAQPEAVAEAIAPGAWTKVIDVLSHLLRRPGASGRWTAVTPLDAHSDPALRMGNSAWTLVPEDDGKHRAVGRLVGALGGERDFAEAMWSFCRGSAGERWRVGRACEIRASRDGVRARLFLIPRVRDDEASQDGGTAGMSSSEPDSSSTSPGRADPSSA